MKKLTFLFAILIATISAQAQTEKGKFSVSGASNLSFSSQERTYHYDGKKLDYVTDISSFAFGTSAKYFVIDNLAVGLGIGFESAKESTDDIDNKANTFLVGPVARYYFSSSNIKPFINGEFMFGNLKNKANSIENKMKVLGWSVGAGAAFFVNEFISLDLSLNYAGGHFTSDEDTKEIIKSNTFVAMFGISVFF